MTGSGVRNDEGGFDRFLTPSLRSGVRNDKVRPRR